MIKGVTTIRILFAVLWVCLALSGCEYATKGEPESPFTFTIRVIDAAGNPLEKVRVQSLVEIEDTEGNMAAWREVLTDQDGRVNLNNFGIGKTGTILQTNYFPLYPTLQPDSSYVLAETPYTSTRLAELEGGNYHFYLDGIISITSNGFYRFYRLSPSGVTSPTQMQLLIESEIVEVEVTGNILSVKCKDQMTHYYSLTDPDMPAILFIRSWQNRLEVLASNDDLLVAIEFENNKQFTKIFELSSDTLIYRSTIPNFYKPHVFLRNQLLLMFYSDGLMVYDISDLSHPVLASRGPSINLDSAFFIESTMIRRISEESALNGTLYETFDLTDPRHPVPTGNFRVPGRLWRMADLEHGFYTTSSTSNNYGFGSFHMTRQTQTDTFQMSGFALYSVEFVQGAFAIASNTLYRWDVR